MRDFPLPRLPEGISQPCPESPGPIQKARPRSCAERHSKGTQGIVQTQLFPGISSASPGQNGAQYVGHLTEKTRSETTIRCTPSTAMEEHCCICNSILNHFPKPLAEKITIWNVGHGIR